MPLESAAGCLGAILEGMAQCFPSSFFGWIGRRTALGLTFGRVDWDTEDWRAVTTGVIVLVGLGMGLWYLFQ